MTKEQILDLLQLLSALESWGFSNGQRMPDYLLERLIDSVEVLRNEGNQMTTEQKIKEAFEKAFPNGTLDDAFIFASGYLALLNDLINVQYIEGCQPVYILPEGVEKC